MILHVVRGPYKMAFNNIGNRRFRLTIALALPRFLNAKSRKDKQIVTESIIELVHRNGGRFLILKSSEGESENSEMGGNSNSMVWTELNLKQTYLKVGHAFRDAERKNQSHQKKQKRNHCKEKLVKSVNQPNPTFACNALPNVSTFNSIALTHLGSTWDIDDYDDSMSISTLSDNEVGCGTSSDVVHQQHLQAQQVRPLQCTMGGTELPMVTNSAHMPNRIDQCDFSTMYWSRQGQLPHRRWRTHQKRGHRVGHDRQCAARQ